MNKICYVLLLTLTFMFGCAAINEDKSIVPVADETPLNIPTYSMEKVVLYITGSTEMQQWSGWDSFKKELSARFDHHAKRVWIKFATQNSPEPTGETGTLLKLYIDSHSRIGQDFRLGAMKFAHIYSKGTFVNLNNGSQFGEHTYNVLVAPLPLNGLFTSDDQQMFDAIATKVFNDIENKSTY